MIRVSNIPVLRRSLSRLALLLSTRRSAPNNYRFNWTFLGAGLLPVLAVGGFNVVMDPYGVIGSPIVAGWNQIKPSQDQQLRLRKSVELEHYRPTTLLLGSSTVMRGLNPRDARFADDTTYNAGVFAAHADELKPLLDYALQQQPDLKQVVIGLDFFMFSEARQTSSIDPPGHTYQDLVNIVFSWDALADSIETLQANRQPSEFAPFFDRGQLITPIDPASFAERPMRDRFRWVLRNYLTNPTFYQNYELSATDLADFRTLVEVCRQRGIELKVFLSPIHASQLELIYTAGLWPVFEQWKREINQMTPVWDFSGYDAISTEPISDTMQRFTDSAHYRPEVGDLILARLFGDASQDVPAGFGVRLTPETIDRHLATIRADRQQWLMTHPEEAEFVQAINQSVQRDATDRDAPDRDAPGEDGMD